MFGTAIVTDAWVKLCTVSSAYMRDRWGDRVVDFCYFFANHPQFIHANSFINSIIITFAVCGRIVANSFAGPDRFLAIYAKLFAAKKRVDHSR